ncbi:MAG: recombinase family protein [Lachnospiraceae bacterium]|nr:recombinase family protein [Lachnospiraceae bacterium]
MAKKVTVIGAVSDRRENPLNKPKLRVCGYARVSTGSRTQTESYATQVAYFTEKIGNNPLWEFAGMYADEAVTGTKVKGRNEFQAMIRACEDGDIDLILTKSVTRFARNTVECIQTIRKLKDLGVGILFEKENINTLTEKSELLLTILSSIAQGESEDFSGNNRWSIEKRFRDGTFITGTPAYGYRNDENGNLVIVEKDAETVRWIFESYLNGLGTYVIAKELNKKRIPTIRAGEKWHDSAVKDILKNPVYEGNRLLQRTWARNGKKKIVWRCSNRLTNSVKQCGDSETLEEGALNRAVMEAIHRITRNEGDFVGAFRQNVIRVIGSYGKEQQPDEYSDRIRAKQEEMVALIAENAKAGDYTPEFDEQYRRIAEEINLLKEEQAEAGRKKKLAENYEQRVKEMDAFINASTCQIPEFDNDLVRRLIAGIRVISADRIEIQFQSGIVMEQEIVNE